MRMRDEILIAEFGNRTIKAIYDYRIDLPHQPDNITVEKIELSIQRPRALASPQGGKPTLVWQEYKKVSAMAIPAWLWEILTDHETISELNTELPEPEFEREPDLKDSSRKGE